MIDARRRTAGPVVPHRATAAQRWIARGIHAAILVTGATQRFRVFDPHRVLGGANPEPRIFALWHNRLALSMQVHRRVVRTGEPGDPKLAALVSSSRDGALRSSILESFWDASRWNTSPKWRRSSR